MAEPVPIFDGDTGISTSFDFPKPLALAHLNLLPPSQPPPIPLTAGVPSADCPPLGLHRHHLHGALAPRLAPHPGMYAAPPPINLLPSAAATPGGSSLAGPPPVHPVSEFCSPVHGSGGNTNCNFCGSMSGASHGAQVCHLMYKCRSFPGSARATLILRMGFALLPVPQDPTLPTTQRERPGGEGLH
jgi:hypothetical protein